MRSVLAAIGSFAEELLLFGIIIINVLQFFDSVTPDYDYLEKVLSWIAIGYIMYSASLTRIIFGTARKDLDFSIVVAYFLIGFQNIISESYNILRDVAEKGIGYWAVLHPTKEVGSAIVLSSPLNASVQALQEIPVSAGLSDLVRQPTIIPGLPPVINDVFVNITGGTGQVFLLETRFWTHRWHNLLLDNGSSIQAIALVSGLLMLLYITWIYTRKSSIQTPSLMQVIGEEGPPRNGSGSIIRFIFVFAVLNFFFIAVFNLIMEWLAVTVDAPLIMIGILFYMFIWIKHHKMFDPDGFIYKIGNLGEDFYEKFIGLFHTGQGLLLGISGMLVLHALTDIGIFLVPYATGEMHQYLGLLGANHEPLISIRHIADSLLAGDLAASRGLEGYSVIAVYVLNIAAGFLLFAGPALIWYRVFEGKSSASRPFISLFWGSITCFLLCPLLVMQRAGSSRLIGVDILTRTIPQSTDLSSTFIAAAAICCMVLVYMLARSGRILRALSAGASIVILCHFAIYMYNFFIDTSSYYLKIISQGLADSEFILACYFIGFFALTIVFYVGGFAIFLYESADFDI
jgi:hypothetical protein